ncbi:MAG: hypothetical protein JXR16_11425 [Bermanella sp.]
MEFKGKVVAGLVFCVVPGFICAQDVNAIVNYESKKTTIAPVYFASSAKLGLHNRDAEYNSRSNSVGEGLSFAIGASVLPILSVEVALNMWFPDEEDEEDEYLSNGGHTFLNTYEFSGISIGSNILLHFPNSGPYAKFGRHCWSANVYETLDVWNGTGCSNTIGGGILFGKNSRGYFIETNRIRYKQVDSWFLTVGFRL